MGIYLIPLLLDTDVQSTFQRPVVPTARAKIAENIPSTKSPNTKLVKPVSLLKSLSSLYPPLHQFSNPDIDTVGKTTI
jgi:hypothetical protein